MSQIFTHIALRPASVSPLLARIQMVIADRSFPCPDLLHHGLKHSQTVRSKADPPS